MSPCASSIKHTLTLHLQKSFSYTKVMYIQHQKLGRKKISGRISSRPISKKLTIDSQAFLTNILFNNIIETHFLFVLLLSLVGWPGPHWGLFISMWGLTLSCRASQVAKWYRTHLPSRRHGRWGFSHWVRKIPWRRKWQPTPVTLPGKCHGQRKLEAVVRGGTKRWAGLSYQALSTSGWQLTHISQSQHRLLPDQDQVPLWCWLFIHFSLDSSSPIPVYPTPPSPPAW